MEFIAVAVLIIAILAFIAYPLFASSREGQAKPETELDALLAQRDSTYDAIRDLDFDYQMGKLSQSDYAALRERYKARAAQVLQKIDATPNGNGHHDAADAQIEEQVRRLRATRHADVRAEDDAIEREVARRRAAKKGATDVRCAKCGTAYQAGDLFCSKCGSKL